MDSQKAFLVIGITLVVVMLINLGIYATLKNRHTNSSGHFRMVSHAVRRARNPWKEDQAKMEALSNNLAALRDSQAQDQAHEET
jgi:ABC-type lipoprotein release transport system permease subunit